MQTTHHDLHTWIGRTLFDRNRDKIGTIADIYVDNDTGQPEWLAVDTTMFGSRLSFVPVAGADTRGDELFVPFDRDKVTGAPNAEADGQLSQSEEATLYRHYGMQYGERRSDSGLPEGNDGAAMAPPPRETAEAPQPRRDKAMTRSEEELVIGVQQRPSERVRLRKYIVTENVTKTVPVQREEVRLEREPITDANVDDALRGPELTESAHEVVLNAEEPVVNKRVVPKERVRIEKETVTDQRKVTDEVRKERIEVEGDPQAKRR